MPPFAQEESREVKDVAYAIVRGGTFQSHTREYARKWAPVVHMAIAAMSRDTASLLHFPGPGDPLEAPYRTMEVFGIIQNVLGDRIRDEYKVMAAKRKR